MPLILQRNAGLPFEVLEPLNGHFAPLTHALQTAQTALSQARTELLDTFDRVLAQLPENEVRTRVYNARKAFFQKDKLPTVALPPDLAAPIAAFILAKNALEQAETAFQTAFDQSIANGIQHLQTVAQWPQVQRALLFSSHTLLQQLPALVGADPANLNKKQRHLAEGLLQYVTRMATRTTPLSQLATVQWANPNQSEHTFPWETETAQPQGKITPNVALLPAFYTVLLQVPVFQDALAVQPNPLLEPYGDQHLRWWYHNGSEEALQVAENSAVVRFILDQLAQNGGRMPFPALVGALAEATDTEPAQTRQYLIGLLDVGMLEWLLPENGRTPSWCGKLYQFLGFVPNGSTEPALTQAAFLLQWLRTAARTLPFQSVQEAAQTQREALEQVQRFFEQWMGHAPNIPAEQLFFEDVGAEGAITGAERVGEHLEALLQVPTVTAVRSTAVRGLLVQRLQQNGPMSLLDAFSVCLDARALSEVPIETAVPTASFSEMPVGALLQPFVENGIQYYVLNALFPGSSKLFARWLHLFPAALTEAVAADGAKYPDWINLNWYSAFNANMHPVLTGQELHLPGSALSPRSVDVRQLELACPPDGQLILREKTTGKQVFIADLGLEQLASRPKLVQILLMVGQPLLSKSLWRQTHPAPSDTVQANPRQVVGPWVVERANWHVPPATYRPWLSYSPADFFLHFSQLAQTWALPHHLFYRLGNMPVRYVCTDSPLYLSHLQKEIAQHPDAPLMLEEMLPVPENRAFEWAILGTRF